MGMGWAVAWMMASAVGAQPGEQRIAPRNAWVVSAPSPSSARIDPSGLARVGEHLVVVSDKGHLPSLYRLVFVDQRQARMEVWRALRDAPDLTHMGHDTEGITRCGDTVWVVVEGANQLVRIPTAGAPDVLTLDFAGVGTRIPPSVTWLNAGLEGVACAPDGRLWVAKEREPRAIYTVDPQTGRATGVWEHWAREDRPQQIAGRAVAPSWSDLQFLDGHLYALHRDARAVVRLAADTGAPTGTMWLALDEQSIYDTSKPYGMAEGLWIEDDAVFILLDNNSDKMKAGPRAGEPAPMLLEYPRPSGF